MNAADLVELYHLAQEGKSKEIGIRAPGALEDQDDGADSMIRNRTSSAWV